MKCFRFLCVVAVMLMVSACSTKVVKTYEGDQLSVDQQAILTAGANIQVASVNGVKQKEYMLSQLDTRYGLKPGKHNVVFYYTSVWARSKVGPEGERSELVESEPRFVEFEVQQGQSVSFDFSSVDNVRDAKVLAENFEASIVDEQGKVLGVSSVYDAQVHATATKSEGASRSAAQSAEQPLADNTAAAERALPALDGLKVLWEKASAEDKKSFLKWAFK